MTRAETIAKINDSLSRLPDNEIERLLELTQNWLEDTGRQLESADDRAAIAEGLGQARRGEFASEEQVEAAFARISR